MGTLLLYKNFKPNQTMVEYGTFLGTSENQYGKLFDFEEENGDLLTLPKCGKLDYMDEKGKFIKGAKYKIVYLGKGIIEKGSYKGKEFHDVDVLLDSDSIESKGNTTAVSKSDIDDILA